MTGSPVVTVACAGCGAEVSYSEPTEPVAHELLRNRRAYCDPCLERLAAEDEQRQAAEREREAAKALDRMRQVCGLPVVFRSATFEGCRADGMPERAVKAAEVWAADGAGLVLTGPVGVGKSTLAAAALDARNRVLAELAAAERGHGSLRLPDCYDRLGACWLSVPVVFACLAGDRDDPRRRQMESVLVSARPLVLDDLDKARPTQYGAEQMFLAVNQRVEHGSALLVTTNMDLDTLEKRWPEEYGAAIVSRLIGHGRAVCINGHDRRHAR
jgi:DNA replication protein DnaC